jgi:hypothetical protein
MTAKKVSKRTSQQKDAQDSAPARKYEPTPQEQAALDELRSRWEERAPAPGVKVVDDNGSREVSLDHEDQRVGVRLLMNAVGTTDSEFLASLLGQIANAASHGQKLNESNTNFMLSVVKSIEPQDEIEAMLATQMAAVHMASMTFARRLANVENIPQQDSAERAFNKLARTFTAQVEALKRYRTGGEQKVTVQHVTVNEGGQAVVGDISRSAGGRGAKKK